MVWASVLTAEEFADLGFLYIGKPKPACMTEKEKQEYTERVVLYLGDNNTHYPLYKLMTSLDIPTADQKGIYHNLYDVKPALIKGNPGIDPEVWLTEHGKQTANSIKIHRAQEFAHNLIEQYKNNALKALKKHGIGLEVFWKEIAEEVAIPESHSDDIKNILIDDGFIIVTTQISEGDFIKGQPNISGYLLGVASRQKSISVTNSSTHIHGDGNKVATTGATLKDSFNEEPTLPIRSTKPESILHRLIKPDALGIIFLILSGVFGAGWYFGEQKADIKNIELRRDVKELKQKIKVSPPLSVPDKIPSSDTSAN